MNRPPELSDFTVRYLLEQLAAHFSGEIWACSEDYAATIVAEALAPGKRKMSYGAT